MPDQYSQTASPAATETLALGTKKISSMTPKSFRGRILTGVLLVIPLAVTAILINYVYTAALKVGVWLVYSFAWIFYHAFGVGSTPPTRIDPANAAWYEILIAVVITVLMFYMLGWLGSNVVGKRIIELFEGLLTRIPFVDTLYGSIKRFVQSLSGVGDKGDRPQRVVLIEFPHPGMKAIGFVTSVVVDRNSGERLATVYIPTAINPTSGYMELVPLDKLIETDMSPAEAMSIVLSGGASAPGEMGLVYPKNFASLR
jgi:uncharacterized membrane protein